MFLKSKNIIFKIRRSNVTDYAALNGQRIDQFVNNLHSLNRLCLKLNLNLRIFCKIEARIFEESLYYFYLFQGQTLQLPVLSVEVLGSIPRTAFTRNLK